MDRYNFLICMKKKMYFLILFIFFFNNVQSNCLDPKPPLKKPVKPLIPDCVDEFEGTHTCSQSEIIVYYNKIDLYNLNLDTYVKELENYLDNANEYVNCEIRKLNAE